MTDSYQSFARELAEYSFTPDKLEESDIRSRPQSESADKPNHQESASVSHIGSQGQQTALQGNIETEHSNSGFYGRPGIIGCSCPNLGSLGFVHLPACQYASTFVTPKPERPESKVSTVKELVTLSAWYRDKVDSPETRGIDRLELIKHFGELAMAIGEATKAGKKKVIGTRAQKMAQKLEQKRTTANVLK